MALGLSYLAEGPAGPEPIAPYAPVRRPRRWRPTRRVFACVRRFAPLDCNAEIS